MSHLLRTILKRSVPTAIKPFARSCYGAFSARREFLQQSRRDRVSHAAERFAPFVLPPPHLRYQVHVQLDPESFIEAAKVNADAICSAVSRQGGHLTQMERILDWGCGPGKVLQAIYWNHLESKVNPPVLYGCDISDQAVSWARRHIPFARFAHTSSLPPLPFEDSFFDLIYGISVFTHLDAEHELVWLNELSRIIKSDGLVIVTVRADHAGWLDPKTEEYQKLQQEGIIFRPPLKGFRKEGLPDCYGNTYHTKAYVLKTYAQHFEVLEYVNEGIRKQDLLVLKRR